jgi:enoyl-CoA hydratase/carnithine racemase
MSRAEAELIGKAGVMSVVTIEQRGPVTIVAINRPEKLNAINRAVAVELQAAFTEFDASDQRVAILTGNGGRAFSAGADVTDLPELWRCVPTVGIATEKPIIAAVAGWCIGGGLVMAMMCDLLIAAENARFSYPEGKVGITGGMIAGLAARIPHKIAMEVMLLGEPIAAQRAYEAGLANRIVSNGTEIDEALAMADKIIELAPLALATMKRFVNEHVLPKGPAELAARFGAELAAVRTSADAAEGVRAFKERRKPRYRGR